MPRLESRWWEPDAARGEHHPAARGLRYEAYVPDTIARYALPLSLELAAELEATAAAVASLQDLATTTGLEALSRQLLRAESIGSSRIEGLALSQRRLARADFESGVGSDLARAVMGNVAAMEAAIQLAAGPAPLDHEALLAIHQTLLAGTRDASIAGQVRTTQNWIGGASWGPHQADFIPPPPEEVPGLLDDLAVFLQRTDLPAMLQAAIAHAQFETIHPFADGNGRVGRALIHAVLRRRGLTPHYVPPLSLVLATNAGRYVEGLTAYRAGEASAWCQTFIRTLHAATDHAARLHGELVAMQARWYEAAGRPREDSRAKALISALPGHPVLDVTAARSLVGGSDVALRAALNDLETAGVLRQVSVGRRNRVWEATELLHLVDDFEWTLATPTRPGEVRRASPPRRTPAT